MSKLLEALAEKLQSKKSIRLRAPADTKTDTRFSPDLRFLIRALQTGRYANHLLAQSTTLTPLGEPPVLKKPASLHGSFDFVLLEEGKVKEGLALTQEVRPKQNGVTQLLSRKPEAQMSDYDAASRIGVALGLEVITAIESDEVHDESAKQTESQERTVKSKTVDQEGKQEPRVRSNETASPNQSASRKKGDGWER